METADLPNDNIHGTVPKFESQWKFKDKVRSIDFVLVWSEETKEKDHVDKRKTYESNLEAEGLELEHEYVEESGLHFVKLHAPLEVLKRYSEILKLRLPMRQELFTCSKLNKHNSLLRISNFISKKVKILEKVPTMTTSYVGVLCSHCRNWFLRNIFIDRNVFPEFHQRFTAIYSRDKEYLFDWKSPNFFNPANKARIVQFILDRTFFINTVEINVFSFGLKQLLDSSVYSAAYPLHDGDLVSKDSMRYKLYQNWASISKWYRYQPLDHIRSYFGVKIGLYFAWLGFYTFMLLPASIVGLACFLISLCLLPKNKPTEDICSETLEFKMCPQCDHCHYWDLSETCGYAKFTFLIDNYTTVFFAVFMSLWAAMFLEMWKRYSAEITHRWDLTGFDTQEEHPRPQYLARLAKLDAQQKAERKVNVVTNSVEPKVPFWKVRFPATIFSFSVVMLLVILAVAAVIGVMLYRVSMLAALSVYGDSIITSYAMILTTTTAASINLVCVFIFQWMYSSLAEYLTELELLRTQTEFDDSLTLKMYLLQFVNYYASIFYIAFFKGHLIGVPSSYNRVFGYRQEECNPGGCLVELSIQLAIIMVGKQAFNTCMEMGYPVVYKWWTSRHLKNISKRRRVNQWEKDYKLTEWGPQALFPEYLEMVLQYGFVTIFVSAFPLAPLFALLNNILETRLDGKKILQYHRRPVPQRVKNIGVWFNILDSVSKLAVITNGFIIAFTSDFVPQFVYLMSERSNRGLTGYLNNSLSFMDTNDLDMYGKPSSSLQYCRYKDYREAPWSNDKYERSAMFWMVLAARLAFVVVFENLVLLVVLGVKCLIPDVSAKLRDQIRREAYLTNEVIIMQEALRAKSLSTVSLDDINELTTLKIRQHPHLKATKRTNSNPEHNTDILPHIPISTSNFSREQIQDAVMIHRPESFGEIDEVCV